MLQQGGLRLSELQQDGFAFGTLRCGLDNRNGDNAEHMGSEVAPCCVAYNVGAPVTVTKIVEGSTPQGPFELTVSCGDSASTFTLDDGGSHEAVDAVRHRLLARRDQRRRRGQGVVRRQRRGRTVRRREGEGEEAGPILEFTTPDIDVELNGVAGDEDRQSRTPARRPMCR